MIKEPYIRKVLSSCVNFVYCNGSRSKQIIHLLPGRWEHCLMLMLLFLPEISVHISRQWDKIRGLLMMWEQGMKYRARQRVGTIVKWRHDQEKLAIQSFIIQRCVYRLSNPLYGLKPWFDPNLIFSVAHEKLVSYCLYWLSLEGG